MWNSLLSIFSIFLWLLRKINGTSRFLTKKTFSWASTFTAMLKSSRNIFFKSKVQFLNLNFLSVVSWFSIAKTLQGTFWWKLAALVWSWDQQLSSHVWYYMVTNHIWTKILLWTQTNQIFILKMLNVFELPS